MDNQTPGQQLKQAWQQSWILKLGSLSILIIALFFAFDALHQYYLKLQQTTQQKQQQLTRLKQIARQQHWQKRTEEARLLWLQIETQLFKAANRSQAQANLQSWINNNIAQLKLDKIKTEIETKRETQLKATKLWKSSISLSARLTMDAVFKLLKLFEVNEQYFYIQSMQYKNNWLKMQIICYTLSLEQDDTPDTTTVSN